MLLKNEGGGVIVSSASDSIYLTVHTAKIRKMK
jgi:hypothetical protein